MTRLENNDITILYLFLLLLLDLLLGRWSSSSDDHFRSETTITETITEPKSLNLWFLSQGYLEKIYYKITFVLFLLFPPPPIRWLRCLTLLLGHLLKCFKAQKIWIWASSWNLFALLSRNISTLFPRNRATLFVRHRATLLLWLVFANLRFHSFIKCSHSMHDDNAAQKWSE